MSIYLHTQVSNIARKAEALGEKAGSARRLGEVDMATRRQLLSFPALLLASAALAPAPAWAQDEAPVPETAETETAEAGPAEGPDILVTAQRREQRLTDVGASI